MKVYDAVILAAGKGSRMKREDSNLIKPLVKVLGKEVIRYPLESFIQNGIERIHVIVNTYEDLSIIKELYPHANILFHVHDNNNSALVAIDNVAKYIDGSFILADCDLVANEEKIDNMVNYGINKINDCDGLVANGINPQFVNNHYLIMDEKRVVGFDKQGCLENKHGGFMYVLTPNFFRYLKRNMKYSDMAYILNGYFSNYEVLPMPIDDIFDVDEKKEIEKAERVLKLSI